MCVQMNVEVVAKGRVEEGGPFNRTRHVAQPTTLTCRFLYMFYVRERAREYTQIQYVYACI